MARSPGALRVHECTTDVGEDECESGARVDQPDDGLPVCIAANVPALELLWKVVGSD